MVEILHLIPPPQVVVDQVVLNGVTYYHRGLLPPHLYNRQQMADPEHQVVVDLVEVVEQVLLQQVEEPDHLLEEILVVMVD
tara:strand:+ start:300 stop:542 length:243 start_codon:yes stop_codon:yes gene_type:complete